MMFVKTRIGLSKIHAIGIFADQFIKKGTILWRFIPGFDLKFTKQQIRKLPPQARKYLDTYSYLSKKSRKYILPIDNAKYFNHSKNPNCLTAYYENEEEVVTKAIRDINSGEEITENYRSFEKGFREFRKTKK